MKKSSIIIILMALVTILCVSTFSSAAVASGNGGKLDAVAGQGWSLTKLNVQASSYDVIASYGKGGTLSASASNSLPGTVVSFTVTPDAGFDLSSLAVISAGGDALELRYQAGVFSFVMPNQSVVIDVTFQLARS